MKLTVKNICSQLKLDLAQATQVEIESKRRVMPEEFKRIHRHLSDMKNVRHQKAAFFFDQFLDTPARDLLRKGASLRVRYKGNGSRIYLQYKGPGFFKGGVLFRSEFSSGKIADVVLEESHHDIVRFNEKDVRRILMTHVPPIMAEAMREHLGASVVGKINRGVFISIYRKEKFWVDLGKTFLEPSLDRIYAFHLGSSGIHPLSSFCEYENEIKANENSLEEKLEGLNSILKFDRKIAKKFDMPVERLDKYHRCGSFFK